MSSAKVEEAQPVAVPSTVEEPTKADEAAPEATSEATSETKAADADVNVPSVFGNGEEKTTKKPRTYENGMLKTSAQERYTGKHNKLNSKYDASILPVTDDHKTIRNQVEFYFSDSNLPGDTYLWNLTDGTENRPVKISKICEFKRMQRFQPISAVIAALRNSEFLEVTGPEGLEEVKRRVPYDPTISRSKAESRSIYAKGFGDEQPSSQFDIEAFFSPYGPLNQVRLRRTDEKLFKGSVFVEFQDDELAATFLALEKKPLWLGKHELKIVSKRQYVDEKEQEIKDGKIQPGPSRGHRGGRGFHRGGDRRNGNDRRGGRDRGDRGDRDPDDWKKRRDDDRANGYKDDRNRRDHKGGRGRGRGRGKRDWIDGGRNRDNNRNGDREDREEKNGDSEKKAEPKAGAPVDTPTENVESKKRAHDNDGEDGGPAKKVDSKAAFVPEEPAVGNPKKRTHDGDGENGGPAEKVDSHPEAAATS